MRARLLALWVTVFCCAVLARAYPRLCYSSGSGYASGWLENMISSYMEFRPAGVGRMTQGAGARDLTRGRVSRDAFGYKICGGTGVGLCVFIAQWRGRFLAPPRAL